MDRNNFQQDVISVRKPNMLKVFLNSEPGCYLSWVHVFKSTVWDKVHNQNRELFGVMVKEKDATFETHHGKTAYAFY